MAYQDNSQQTGADVGVRTRQMTEKGREYRRTLKMEQFSRSSAKLRQHLSDIDNLLAGEIELRALKQCEYRMIAELEGFEAVFRELHPLLEAHETDDYIDRYEGLHEDARLSLAKVKAITTRADED